MPDVGLERDDLGGDRLEQLDPNALSATMARTEQAMEVTRSLRPAALEDEAWSEDTLP